MAIRALMCALLLLAGAGRAGAQGEPDRAEDLRVMAGERRNAIIVTPPRIPEIPVSLNGALRLGAQWLVNPPRARDDVFGWGGLDVLLTARPTPNVSLLVDVEGHVGPGPEQAVGFAFTRERAGRERVGEAYYNVSLADWCQIIANVEWIFSGPNQVTGRRQRDVVVSGLRALILF